MFVQSQATAEDRLKNSSGIQSARTVHLLLIHQPIHRCQVRHDAMRTSVCLPLRAMRRHDEKMMRSVGARL